MIKSILFPLLVCLAFNVNAQSTNREVGIKLYRTNHITMLLKKEKKLGVYRRYSGSFEFITAVGSSNNFSNKFSFSMGFEKRNTLTDKFDFIHGFNPGVFASSRTANSNSFLFNTGVTLGYILGFQYHINKEFSVGIETIPTFALSTSFNFANTANQPHLTGSFSANQLAGIFLVYKFKKK